MSTDSQFNAPENLGIAVYSNNAEAIGNTPLVRINRVIESAATVLAKVESRNPAFSVKDRVGAALISDAEAKGLLKKGMHIVEPTSGNTGIALAYVAAAKGYDITLTMPSSMSIERRKVLKALGANLLLTDPAKGMKGAIEEAERLVREQPETYYLPQQFENPANPEIHEKTTGPEIWAATAGKVDILVSGVGTGGTLTGISRYFEKVKNQAIYSVAVEPAESAIITQAKKGETLTPGPHKIQGIGANFIPKNLDLDLVDEVIAIPSDEAIDFARKTATQEGLLVGISSGAAIAAASKLAARPENAGKTIVVVLPDGGERYLSSVLFADISAE
ncbi:cysteine synthase A [Acinetobacter gerneri]|jgi:cysteine synthase A|uniref:Cysteine synthase n=1 Tax=Acinetobacter gerneri TaxID=202952 RepID=A0AAW8JIP0_9GAMM|nr:cysteine synthase A [Acinetobacter gerneri]MCH4244055.1 cysteine synthase A [Acinetobacter gerneri]MDQ9010802.1 cysteine synthase A [Acinetobacter gerneri]MDQ9014938.1 cysteine synthase A [Acinetobacter gerneri]MDQ9026129.1 cysteine synthase A [Acinetobacter gerneri]MDQ9053410.1 cysteine synthase A [Acinetobacter gerneri]